LTPFYFFQIFSIIVWLIEQYWIYACALFFTSALAALVSLYQTRKNLIKLKEMSKNSCSVTRCNVFNQETISSEELVPGDVIDIPKDFVLPCDCIVLSGQAIVNESMLTGESIPIIKTCITQNDVQFIPLEHTFNILYSGTSVMDAKPNTRGLVFKSAFSTAKGKLILSILYPKPSQFRFYADSLKFVGVMFILGTVGMVYSFAMLSVAGASWFTRIIRMLDVITISVPPALPLAMSVGISYAVYRLSQDKIFCISPPRVNLAGMIECMCFDKTGTLTEEGLILYAVRPVGEEIVMKESVDDLKNQHLQNAMMTCHGLSFLDSKLIGDPLEVSMFESTGARMEDDGEIARVLHNDTSLQIVKRFEFTSSLQRMSVITKSDVAHRLYVKGSPEAISRLSQSVPDDYAANYSTYTKHGYRVIACAYRELSDSNGTREELENNLNFLGFIIFENKIKPTTANVISSLKDAQIVNIMVTGDNPLTAISVAKQSGIIQDSSKTYQSSVGEDDQVTWKDIDSDLQLDYTSLLDPHGKSSDFELVMTGPAFKVLFDNHSLTSPSEIVYKILSSCRIYSRMLPEQKMRLIEELMACGKYTGMCGDGCNDVSSLKTAHVGVSLSQAEASIAAPFTSTVATIECVPTLMREGRCSLITSFILFKFICLYSFVQTISVLILYSLNANLSDFQFLYVDLFIITPIVLTMGRTGPSSNLSKQRPPVALFSVLNFASLFGQLGIAIAFQVLVFVDLGFQPWYRRHVPTTDMALNVVEVTAVFLMSQYQTINIALTYSLERVFRKPIYTNFMFTFSVVILSALGIYFIFMPDSVLKWLFSFADIPSIWWKLRLFIYCMLHFAVAFIFEHLVVAILFEWMNNKLYKLIKRKTLYEKVAENYQIARAKSY
jgi:cation-transporting ATPase 13A2